MSGTLKLLGLSVLALIGSGALGCSSDESEDGASGGSAGSAGSAGSSGSGGSAGASCGLVDPVYRSDCRGPAECCDAQLPVMTVRQNGALVAPDWSCIMGGGGSGGTAGMGAGGMAGSGGTAGMGAGGMAGSGGTAGMGGMSNTNQNVFEVEDFGSGDKVADLEVELFEGESVIGKTPFFTGYTKGPGTCADSSKPCPMELNTGQFYFPHPSFPYLSYRVKESQAAKEFYGFGEDVPAIPGKVTGATVTPDTFLQLAISVVTIPGWTPPPDKGIVTAPIRDCAGNDVGGALFTLIDEASGEEVKPGTCADQPRYVYFDGNLPNLKCAHSDYRQALMLIINAPVNTSGADMGKKYKLQFMGRFSDSDTAPKVFAEKSLEIFANVVNVHQIRPNVQQ